MLAPPEGGYTWITAMIVISVVLTWNIIIVYGMAEYFKKNFKSMSKTGKFMFGISLMSNIMVTGRLICDILIGIVAWKENNLCRTFISISMGIYATSMLLIHLFFWCRQQSFYINPILEHLRTFEVIIISRSTLAIILLGGISVSIMYLFEEVTGWVFKRTKKGCEDVGNEIGDWEILPIISVTMVSFTNLGLVYLFIKPMIKKSFGNMDPNKNKKEEHSILYKINYIVIKRKGFRKNNKLRNRKTKKLMKTVKKTIIITAVGIIAEFSALLAQNFWVTQEIMFLALFDVNLLIQNICIILSYNKGYQMIFPF